MVIPYNYDLLVIACGFVCLDIEAVASKIPDVQLYHSGPGFNGISSIPRSVNLDKEIVNSNAEDVPESVQKCTNFGDKLLYIYTSGKNTGGE